MASRATRGSVEGASTDSERTTMSDSEFANFYQTVFLPLFVGRLGDSPFQGGCARCRSGCVPLGHSRIDSSKNPRAWLIQVVDHLALNLQKEGSLADGSLGDLVSASRKRARGHGRLRVASQEGWLDE